MGILNSWQLTASTLLVLLATGHLAAGDDLIVQTISNPLNMGPHRFPNSPPPPQPPPQPQQQLTELPIFEPLPPPASSPASPKDSIDDMIAENALQFGHNMIQQLSNMDPYATRSEIFSPLSLMSALSLLMLGAKGKSYQELKTVLGLENIADFNTNPGKYHQIFSSMLSDMEKFDVNAGIDTVRRKRPNWFYTAVKKHNNRVTGRNVAMEEINHTINIANGLFVQEGYTLNPDYRQVVSSIYDGHLAQLDYKTKTRDAVKYINAWSNDNTNGKIPELIKAGIPSTTNVILASTLYFRGFWQTPFFPRSTREDNFYQDGPNTKPIRALLMATGGLFPFYNAKEYDCRIIGMPYKGNETTMYIIQPNDSTRLKLRGLLSVLDARKINDMIDKMTLKTTVMVFPKMHFTRTMTLNDILPAMGVASVFNPGLSDLSLIGGRNTATPLPALSTRRKPLFSSVATPVVQAITTPGRKGLAAASPQFNDRYNEKPLIFSRFGEEEEGGEGESAATTTENPDMETIKETTPAADHAIEKRQVSFPDPNLQALHNLEAARNTYDGFHSDLFVNEIIHKVDFAVDEQGTEAAAATAAYLYRSGTDVVFRGDTPFLILIRHDHTKMPLFYGVINKPEL